MLARTSIFHISKEKIIVNLSNSAIKWLLNCQNIPSLLVIKIWIILWRSTMIRNITFITSVMIEWQSSGTVMRTGVAYSEGVLWQWDLFWHPQDFEDGAKIEIIHQKEDKTCSSRHLAIVFDKSQKKGFLLTAGRMLTPSCTLNFTEFLPLEALFCYCKGNFLFIDKSFFLPQPKVWKWGDPFIGWYF